MALRVVWTAHAQAERLRMLRYWTERNSSKAYSAKLDKLIRSTLRILARHPLIGRPVDHKDVRVKVIGDHLIFYAIREDELIVLSLWDNRRDPADRPY